MVCYTKKTGWTPPTRPTPRPHVLTPCDHFARRGGGRDCILCIAAIRNQGFYAPRRLHTRHNNQNTNFLLLAHSSLKFSSHPFASRLRKECCLLTAYAECETLSGYA